MTITVADVLHLIGALILSATSFIFTNLLVERFTRVSRARGPGFAVGTLVLASLVGLFLTQRVPEPPALGQNSPPLAAPTSEAPTAAAPTSAAAPTHPPTATTSSASPPPTSLPYRADWSSGLDGWGGSEEWEAAGGLLVNTGQGNSTQASIVAPLDLSSVDSYAVDADIQLVRYEDEGMFSAMDSFGIVVRAQDDGTGYGAGHCVSSGFFACSGNQPTNRVSVLWEAKDFNNTTLDIQPVQPSVQSHHYRVEVRGDQLKVLIDGAEVLSATDNTYLRGKRVGLWSDRCQINVRSFTVTAL